MGVDGIQPCTQGRATQGASGTCQVLERQREKKLLKATKESENPHLHAIVLIAITSGARQNEILDLRWKDVDLTKKMAVFENTKNNERRSLTLVPQVVDELKRLKKVRRIDDDRSEKSQGASFRGVTLIP